MMQYAKQRKLVDFLLEKTASSKISWSDSGALDEPRTKLGEHWVQLAEGRSANGSSLYSVVLATSIGEEVDRFDDEDLDAGDPNSSYYMALKELHMVASRQAKGADAALDDVLNRIQEI